MIARKLWVQRQSERLVELKKGRFSGPKGNNEDTSSVKKICQILL